MGLRFGGGGCIRQSAAGCAGHEIPGVKEKEKEKKKKKEADAGASTGVGIGIMTLIDSLGSCRAYEGRGPSEGPWPSSRPLIC